MYVSTMKLAVEDTMYKSVDYLSIAAKPHH